MRNAKNRLKFEGHYKKPNTNLAKQRCAHKVKGVLPQKKFYRPNLIFWIVMGCCKACFGRTSTRHAHETRGNPRWYIEATRNDRGFLALPIETSITTSHYYPQYEVWAMDSFGGIPLRESLTQRIIDRAVAELHIFLQFGRRGHGLCIHLFFSIRYSQDK